MIFEINSKEELKKTIPPNTRIVKINFEVSTPRKIVEIVSIYKDSVDVWVRTNMFKKLLVDNYLIFRKQKKGTYKLKRALDVCIATIVLTLTAPLLLIVSMIVKFSASTSKEPVFFRQNRISNNGKPFLFYKFRTMEHSNNNDIHYEYMKKSIRGKAHGKVYKLVNDPRVTKIGKWLRRLSIDEIPQFINVLKNDMSVIGPRPPILYEVELYEDWQKVRLMAKPGMTGLWQVTGRSLLSFNEMVVLDFFYALNQSLKLDLYILIHTIPAVFFLKGAY
jgi:lipopolysaccharide/colanic/teichoic acid biosynthesis glycosyltransferase